jgi:hypothetical protein
MNTERMRSDCLRPPFSLIALTLLAEPITYTLHGPKDLSRSAGGVAIGGTTVSLPTEVITFTRKRYVQS